jgi:predicted ribosomally synthesized peptide with SipW-like signal peptide
MNTKILLSLSVIAAVAAIAIGGTVAYLTDTETSTGNTFTAATLDLSDGLSTKKFSLDNMKPGDMIQGKYEIKASGIKYWACMKPTITEKPENDVLEMEADAGDKTSDVGELQDFISLCVWNDRDGDGIYIGDGTNPDPSENKDRNLNCFGPGALNQLNNQILTLEDSSSLASFFGPADSQNPTRALPLEPDKSYNLGVAYCFGTLSVDSTAKKLICSGAGDQNIAQSDGVSGTITFYAVQADNNPNFTCSGASF